MTTIKAVLFDIGNVLIEWNPEGFYDKKIGYEARKALFNDVDLHQMNDLIDEGALFKETIYETAQNHPKWEAEVKMWYDNWIEIASPRIEHSWRLLRALRAKSIPVFALSNFGIYSFQYAETHYPELKEFDHRYISGYMGVIKPNPRIYEMVEEHSGFRAETLLFTDDREDNIQAAHARGWNVHLFKSSHGWAESLVQHNLLRADEAM